jgi:small subunit ribosomal protein S2
MTTARIGQAAKINRRHQGNEHACRMRLFVIDVGYHKIAITEANKLGIPVIAMWSIPITRRKALITSSRVTMTLQARFACTLVALLTRFWKGRSQFVEEIVSAVASDDDFVEEAAQ